MWLQRMRFEAVEGWSVQDANKSLAADAKDGETILSDSTALIQPQDTRQYVYILSPKDFSPFPVTHPPGAIIPLGRLDICWRSSFGEPGRLLTSVRSYFLFLQKIYSDHPSDAIASYSPNTRGRIQPTSSTSTEAARLCPSPTHPTLQYDRKWFWDPTPCAVPPVDTASNESPGVYRFTCSVPPSFSFWPNAHEHRYVTLDFTSITNHNRPASS